MGTEDSVTVSEDAGNLLSAKKGVCGGVSVSSRASDRLESGITCILSGVPGKEIPLRSGYGGKGDNGAERCGEAPRSPMMEGSR